MVWKRSRVRISPGPPQPFKDLRLPEGSHDQRWSPTGVQNRFEQGHPWARCGFWYCPRPGLHPQRDLRHGQCGHRFQVCCLLETTTIAFPMRMLPVAPMAPPQFPISSEIRLYRNDVQAGGPPAPDCLRTRRTKQRRERCQRRRICLQKVAVTPGVASKRKRRSHLVTGEPPSLSP